MIIRPNSLEKPSKLVYVLHGYGADSTDLEIVGSEISSVIPEAEIHLPDAFEPCESGFGGNQWFSLREWGSDHKKLDIMRPSILLSQIIEDTANKYDLTIKDVALVGFSQGGMMALHTGIMKTVGAVVSFSGALLDPSILDEYACPPTLLIHGNNDQVVPPESFEAAVYEFESRRIPIEKILINGLGHTISQSALSSAKNFIKLHLT